MQHAAADTGRTAVGTAVVGPVGVEVLGPDTLGHSSQRSHDDFEDQTEYAHDRMFFPGYRL